MSALAPTVEAFFAEWLAAQRESSPHTITAYSHALRLLFSYVYETTGKPPSKLDIADLDATLITAFLAHLEQQRGNSVATRNARLSAIRSLFAYAALRHPEHAEVIQRVLAIPAKRHEHTIVCFLTSEEIDALLAAVDRGSWIGRHDHAVLLFAIQTGLRISELSGLVCDDVHLAVGAHVRCRGKGRKNPATPLTDQTVAVLKVGPSSAPASLTSRCFPADAAVHSVPMRSSGSPPSTRPQPPGTARRSTGRTSPRTRSAIQRRCSSSKPGSMCR